MICSQFYQTHLNQVSRSFAFCIEQLSEDIKLPISHMYLVCRILDTIEDSQWAEHKTQVKSFNAFVSFFEQKKTRNYKTWQDNFESGYKPSEMDLIKDTSTVVEDFFLFPKPVQKIIFDLITTMSTGMQKHSQTNFKINSMSELNEYCYYVAGVVGESLTEIVSYYNPQFTVDNKIIFNSLHFGLFLQKINFLKDQTEDSLLGRHFVFDRLEVIESLRIHADCAIEYILSIPVELKSYRKFCSWSLFLGLGSFKYIEKSYLQKTKIKISRIETKLLLGLVDTVIDNNKLLKGFYSKMVKSVLGEPINNLTEPKDMGDEALIAQSVSQKISVLNQDVLSV